MIVGVTLDQAQQVMQTNDDALAKALANTVISLTFACRMYQHMFDERNSKLEPNECKLDDRSPGVGESLAPHVEPSAPGLRGGR